MATRPIRKLISVTLGLIVLGSLWFYLAPTSVGGSTTYVVTNGVSMEPRFHTGDLAVVRSQSSYHVGEIVAYNNKMFHTVVLHRIIGRVGDRYLFKGDNNNFVDFEHPLASQLIGSLWLHIPGGGARLKSIRSPALIGILAAIGMLFFTGAAFTRKRRRRRRQTRPGESAEQRPAGHLHQRSVEPVVGVLAVGLLALMPFVVVALVGFTRPLTVQRPFNVPYKQSGRFSYSADAPPGPAYPGNHAVTGEPLFTHVLNDVNVRFGYLFETTAKHSLSGKASIVATVASSTGWHATLPLGAPTYFRGDHTSVSANLDLPSLIALIHRVQATTFVSGTYTLTLTPHVSTAGSLELIPLRASFSPKLQFTLSEAEAEPTTAGGSLAAKATNTSEFTPSASGSATGKRYEPLSVSFGFAHTTVATARAIALAGIAVVLLALLAVLALVRPRLRSESATIRARYGRLIVPVAHVWQLPGAPVIEVADIDALARLAEHYERSILYEVTAEGDAFWVTDESGQFRYTVSKAWTTDDTIVASSSTPDDASAARSAPAAPAEPGAPATPAAPAEIVPDPPTLSHELVPTTPEWSQVPALNAVYADELELGDAFASSAAPTVADFASDPAVDAAQSAEPWALPADADAFVQEGVDRRRTDEDVDVSLWRRSGEAGDGSAWRRTDDDSDVSLWRRAPLDSGVGLRRDTEEDSDVSMWQRTGEPLDSSPEAAATSGAYLTGLEWTTNS